MNQIISAHPAPCIGVDFASKEQITLDWIQSLPAELKDAALYKLCKIVEAKPTLVESFTLNQVLYRTISGGTFTESADSAAKRTGHDRKTILKGLNQAVEQNILEENKRPGTSNEYFFKPVEEWYLEPVVPIADIRNKKIIEFPLLLEGTKESVNDEAQQPVLTTDDPETDANNVVINKLVEQTTTEVSVLSSDTNTSSHWKYVGQGLPRVYIAPELDQDTGNSIESIHEATKEPRQFIIKHAVELLYDRLNRIPSVAVEKPVALTALSAVAVPSVVVSSIPVQKSHQPPTDEALADAMRELRRLRIEDNATVRAMIKRLWCNFSGAYESIKQRAEQGEVFVNITGAFVNALKNGDKPEATVVVEQVLIPQPNIDSPSAEEMALIDDAIATGRAKDKYYGSLGWLVIENNGHTAPWQQFLTMLKEGYR